MCFAFIAILSVYRKFTENVISELSTAMETKKSNPKRQHYVPACYLREFVDPRDGLLWVFSKDGKNVRRQKPEKTFTSNHLYTINISGNKDYRIEQTLSNIEGNYAGIFQNKIKKKLPLTDYEHIILCVFVAAQLQRTLRMKKNHENFIQQIIEHGKQLLIVHGKDTNSKQMQEWESYKNDIHKLQLLDGLPFLTNILHQMSVAFVCSANAQKHWFITSDDPCTLFNPDLQWQRFYGPGFGQKNVQLTMPLSPEITVLFCWANYHGYSFANAHTVEEMMNRMTRGHCHKEFVSPSGNRKWVWFSRVPLDPIFLIKVLKTRFRFFLHDIKAKWRRRKYKRYG